MIRNRRSFFALLAVASFIACSAFACNNYHTAVMMEHDFELSVKAAQQVEESEFNAGHIEKEYHQQFQTVILSVAQGGKGIASLLQSNATKQTILSEVDMIDQTLQDAVANGTLGIKNQATKNDITAALRAVQAILANFKTFMGGVK